MTEKLKTLVPSRMTNAEFKRLIWSVEPEPGTEVEDLLAPRYWAHVARNLRPGHRIEACPVDTAWWAELLVLSCDENGANVTVLRANNLRAPAPAAAPKAETAEAFDVKFNGGDKWCVIRKADRRVVKSKLATEGEARAWLAETYGEGALA